MKTVEICRYFGPNAGRVPADAWVAVKPRYYRRRRANVLFLLPDATPLRGATVVSDDLTAYLHDIPVKRAWGGWTLANPEDAALLEASADASLSHVRACAEDLAPTLDLLRRVLGGED